LMSIDGCAMEFWRDQAPELSELLRRLNVGGAWSLEAAAELAQELFDLPPDRVWPYRVGALISRSVQDRAHRERPLIAPALPRVEGGRVLFGEGRTLVWLELAPHGRIRVSAGYRPGEMSAEDFREHPRARAFLG